MFSTSKSKSQKALQHAKETLSKLPDKAHAVRHELEDQVGKNAHSASSKLKSALHAISSGIRAKSSEVDTDKLKDHMKLRLADWKESVSHEAKQTLKTGRVKSKRMLRKRSLLSLGVAAGIGAALGYLAAHRSEVD